MEELVKLYSLKKVANIVVGGHDGQSSVKKGLDAITEKQYEDNDTVVIHDGVRPLVEISTISGSQEINREIEAGNHMPDFRLLLKNLENKFGGKWYVLLRLHPQLTARHINSMVSDERLIYISSEDDMYEILAGCDAFMMDYLSAAFDAMVMKTLVFYTVIIIMNMKVNEGNYYGICGKIIFRFQCQKIILY